MRLTSWQDPYHVTVPNKIDTRERDMICVICFNLVKNIKDQLSMQPVFGNLDNLVINHNNRWDLYWSHPADNDEIRINNQQHDVWTRSQTQPKSRG
jgi:hypothetical protein